MARPPKKKETGPFRITVKERDAIGPIAFVPGRIYTVNEAIRKQLGDNAVNADE